MFFAPRNFSTAWLQAYRRSARPPLQPIFLADFEANAVELAAGLRLHLAKAVCIQITRMRIEFGEHAVELPIQ